jgi:plasmid stabilization system protein ParE
MRVEWTTRALRDVFEQEKYLSASQSPEAAREWTDLVFERIGLLAAHPRLGRASARAGRREVVVDQYVAFYSVRRDVVWIHSFRHGSRRR